MEPDHQTAVDDERWAQALSVLQEQPTAEAADRLRRFEQRTLWAAVGGIVVGIAVVLLIVTLVSGSRGAGDDAGPPAWQELLGTVVTGVGVLIELGAFVVMVRAGLFRRDRWVAPSVVLTRAQRRLLIAQVRGRAAVQPERLPLARDAARRMQWQQGMLAFLVGVLLLQIGIAISSPGTRQTLQAAFFVVLYVVLFVVMERNARQARRFLAAHSEPGPAG